MVIQEIETCGCCNNIYNCHNFKENGYNCLGKNQFGKISPWGIKEKTDFDYYIKHNLIGSCKCLDNHIVDTYCPCGTIGVFLNENYLQLYYLSSFKNLIQKRANLNSKLDIKLLETGIEINYDL